MKFVFRTLVAVVVLVAATYLLGYWSLNQAAIDGPDKTVGTSGQTDRASARKLGADVGERAAQATQTIGDLASDTGLTAKIKSKMALDDHVRARTIDVTTTGGIVTLTGTVGSVVERNQAIRLARDTVGITQVIDRMDVR